MSMLDLFRHSKPPSPSPSPSASLIRPASCVTLLLTTDVDHDAPWLEKKLVTLKRCATTAARTTTPLTKCGWGIVPVLNELERRSSSNSLLNQRSRSAKQLLCLNCRHLYFPNDSQCTPVQSPSVTNSLMRRTPSTTNVPLHDQFCSLDCKSSYACHGSVQDLVDLQLNELHSSASSDEDAAVVTLDDDTELSI